MSGYIGTQPVPQATQHRETFTATASQTTFATVGYTPQFVDVYLNGIHLLDTVDYTATNSSDVVLTAGAAASDVVEIISYTPFEVANQTFTGTTTVDVLTAAGAFTSLGIDDNATSTAITIDASENVGIGTSSPSAVLHSLSSGSSDTGVFERGDVSGTSRITIKSGDGSYGTINATDGGNTLAFYTGATEAMRVDASGNVSIGETSNPGYRLSIKGAGTPQLINRTGSDGVVILFQNDGVSVGNISVTGSATAYNTSSDYRLKENITPIQGAVDIVKMMQPCTYTFKSDGSWHDGFLAHELQELHPRAVLGEKDAVDEDGIPDYQGVDYSKLTPILTAALKEALNKIEVLEAQNAAFETRLTALEVTP